MNDDQNAKLLLETVPGVMRSIREEMRGIARGKFTVPQFRILNQLRKSPLTNSELADWMGVTAPTMSRMLEPLEEKGYILRTSNPEDRRSQSLTLSALGKREAEKIRRQALYSFAKRIQELSNEESHSLAQGLQVLAKLFNHETKDAPAERKRTSMKIKSMTLLMLAALTVSLSSCLGDMNADDYAKHQSDKELAKSREVQDTFTGALISGDNTENPGKPLGTLTLSLSSATQVQNNGVTKLQVPVANGTLTYNGLNQSQITFSQFDYDPNDRLLNIQIPVTDASNTTQLLMLRATLQEDRNTLVGQIEASGGYSAQFSLIRRGPLVQLRNLSSIRGAAALSASHEDYIHIPSNVAPDQVDELADKLTIEYQGSSSQQRFVNLFLPERAVSVTLKLRKKKVTFNSIRLDERTNRLKSDPTTITNLGGQYTMTLDCTRKEQGTVNENWDCMISAGDDKNHVIFSLNHTTQN
jgi:DNA-binding MarR family transcriptional regulator